MLRMRPRARISDFMRPLELALTPTRMTDVLDSQQSTKKTGTMTTEAPVDAAGAAAPMEETPSTESVSG